VGPTQRWRRRCACTSDNKPSRCSWWGRASYSSSLLLLTHIDASARKKDPGFFRLGTLIVQ
jgi:hypothetical protein